MTKIQAFFSRIGLAPETKIEYTVDLLGRIQTACVLSIAYENLDILAGKPILLTPEALFDKIITCGRGGYCFELNGLLTHMLRDMGFSVSERFARFLRGEREIPMRRHRVTVVSLPDGDYLLDIGVGQIAPRLPLKITEGVIQEQNGESYRCRRDSVHGWVLEDLHHGEWRDYIGFSDDLAFDVDFLQPSFFCEVHPDSVFNKAPMIAIKTPAGRCTIDGRTYKEFIGEDLVHMEENVTDQRFDELLTTIFKLKG